MIAEVLWSVYNVGIALYRQPRVLRRRFRSWRQFWKSYKEYCSLSPRHLMPEVRYLYPCLDDNGSDTQIEPIYFYQDSWAFERITQANPEFHVDVGSHHKFVALLSKVVPVTMIDIRPLSLEMPSIRFQRGSILSMPFAQNALPSVSSICVVEHIGLGRYGDLLDWQGTEKAIAELKRVVAPGGDLYISVPLDDVNRVCFNAHRTFVESYILSLLAPFVIVESNYIVGNVFTSIPGTGFQVGCYHARKPASA